MADPFEPPSGSRSTSCRPATTRPCGAPAPRRCVWSASALDPRPGHRPAVRHPLASPPPTDLAPDGARVYTRPARGPQARDRRRPRRRPRSGRRPGGGSRRRTIGSLVLRRAAPARSSTRTPRSTSGDDGRARPARVPRRDLAPQEGRARGRLLAVGDHPRSCSTPRRPAIRPPRRRSTSSSIAATATRSSIWPAGSRSAADARRSRGPFAYAPDGTKVFVALDGGNAVGAARAADRADADRRRHRQAARLAARGGGRPARRGQAFAAQRHPLGRITFVSLGTDAIRTVTGFDLNSDVVQWRRSCEASHPAFRAFPASPDPRLGGDRRRPRRRGRLLERRQPDRVGARAAGARPDPAQVADRVRRLGARSRDAARSRGRRAAAGAAPHRPARDPRGAEPVDRHNLFVVTRGEEAIAKGQIDEPPQL